MTDAQKRAHGRPVWRPGLPRIANAISPSGGATTWSGVLAWRVSQKKNTGSSLPAVSWVPAREHSNNLVRRRPARPAARVIFWFDEHQRGFGSLARAGIETPLGPSMPEDSWLIPLGGGGANVGQLDHDENEGGRGVFTLHDQALILCRRMVFAKRKGRKVSHWPRLGLFVTKAASDSI